MEKTIELGLKPLTIEDLINVSCRGIRIALSDNVAWRTRMQASADYTIELWQEKKPIYGVTTGYGRSSDVSIPSDQVKELPILLSRFHGCGLGSYLTREQSRAVIVARAASFCQGLSGVRIDLLERLCQFLNHDLVPLIPCEGSVGASGDLTPLSYLAALVIGEREVLYKGRQCRASEALTEVGLEPLELLPKEALALMNGTSVMTALAALVFQQASTLLERSVVVSAINAIALGASCEHFNPRFFRAKAHKGQLKVAEQLYRIMETKAPLSYAYKESYQARYSIRCAPHVLGVMADALPWMREQIETELNSANDNPLVDGEEKQVFHGGHFYGGHIAFAMDSMKNAIANIADLLDRQLELLVDCNTNNQLPRNLSGASSARAAINHGFKAVQIGTSAWAAEALKNTMPASVFSRSTESHNQDKVSMGTIAARDCLRVIELTEQVLAATMMAGVQALDLRERSGELDVNSLTSEVADMYSEVRESVRFLEEDRALETDLRQLISSFGF